MYDSYIKKISNFENDLLEMITTIINHEKSNAIINNEKMN